MKNRGRRLLLMALGCFLASCGGLKKSNPETAIRQAIEEHLAGRTGLASDKIIMDMKKVEVHGDRADAEVLFRSRSDPKASMSFHYQLRNEGNRWKIDTGHPAGEATAQPPSVSPPQTSPPASAPPLPEGHPSVKP